jgi:hypothetical protein
VLLLGQERRRRRREGVKIKKKMGLRRAELREDYSSKWTPWCINS